MDDFKIDHLPSLRSSPMTASFKSYETTGSIVFCDETYPFYLRSGEPFAIFGRRYQSVRFIPGTCRASSGMRKWRPCLQGSLTTFSRGAFVESKVWCIPKHHPPDFDMLVCVLIITCAELAKSTQVSFARMVVGEA